MTDLSGRTLLISGGSRGIGLAIALRAAADGANVALLAKTGTAHPRLAGTVHTAAAAVEQAGGRALAVVGDVRQERDVDRAVAATVEAFGGIDLVVNNASAIDLSGTTALSMKRFDLMHDVNCRGAFLLAQRSIEQLQRSDNPHILTLSPPINLDPRWAGAHLGYTISKYSMSLVTLGLAQELAPLGIAANSLWPRTIIATAALGILPGGTELADRARVPQIMADAAHRVLTSPATELTGQFLLDEDVLRQAGVSDFAQYAAGSGELMTDLFLDD